jgi:CHAD domain-containing protein
MAVNIAETETRRNARQTMPRPERSSPVPPRHDLSARRKQNRQQALKAGTRPRRSAPAGEAVVAYLRIQAGGLVSYEPKVRADEYDSVHQVRVATRRLRAALRTFGQVIPRSRSAKLAAELKWFGGLLGSARDGEVIPDHLQAALRPIPAELLIGPVQARVQGYFAPRRAAAREELIEALDGPRYRELLAELDQLCHEPPSGPRAGDPARDVLPVAVRQAYRQADKRMRQARHTPQGPALDAALHQTRKAARRELR